MVFLYGYIVAYFIALCNAEKVQTCVTVLTAVIEGVKIWVNSEQMFARRGGGGGRGLVFGWGVGFRFVAV